MGSVFRLLCGSDTKDITHEKPIQKKKHCHSMKEKPMARVNFVIRTGYVQLNALHSHLLCLWFVKTWLSFECKLNHLGVRFFLFSIHLFLSLWLATTKHVTKIFGLDSCMRRVYLFDWMLRTNRQIQSRSNNLINKYCSNGYRAIWWQVIPNCNHMQCKRIKYYVYLFLWFGLFSPDFLESIRSRSIGDCQFSIIYSWLPF